MKCSQIVACLLHLIITFILTVCALCIVVGYYNAHNINIDSYIALYCCVAIVCASIDCTAYALTYSKRNLTLKYICASIVACICACMFIQCIRLLLI